MFPVSKLSLANLHTFPTPPTPHLSPFLLLPTHHPHHLVTCGVGHFAPSGNLLPNYCTPCPVGSYQPLTNQSSCHSCSTGYSTPDLASVTSNDCSGLSFARCNMYPITLALLFIMLLMCDRYYIMI